MKDSFLDETKHLSLCEAIDRVLNKGAVVFGEVMISVANVDLVYIALQVVVSSIETLHESMPANSCSSPAVSLGLRGDNKAQIRAGGHEQWRFDEEPGVESKALGDFSRVMRQSSASLPRSSHDLKGQCARLSLDRDKAKNGLVQLVLTLVKLLHELVERQAIRRIEAGSLSDCEIERVGVTLMRQAEEIERMRKEFGLDEEDLNLDLGPLGRLL